METKHHGQDNGKTFPPFLGGVQTNVIPDKFDLTFDIRITPTTNLEEFEKMIRDLFILQRPIKNTNME